MKRTQAGFTMIELVIVIVILGILAATALPRFVDLGGDARVAKANAALGAMQSAANLAHATSLAQGKAANGAVLMEGQSIAMANYYPTVGSILLAAGLTDTGSYTPGGSGTTRTVAIVGGKTTCFASYTQPTAAGNAPVFSGQLSTGAC